MAAWDEGQQLFTDCRKLTAVSSPSWDTGGSISADGSTLYFESDRLGDGHFPGHIFSATWDSQEQDFVRPEIVEELKTLPGTQYRPSISASGHELHFIVEPHDFSRNTELWVAWRHALDEPFRSERARPLDEINSPHDDFSPVLSADGKVLLWTGWVTDGPAGGSDFSASSIWMATRADAFDPEKHVEPPRFGDVRKLALSVPVNAYNVAVSPEWPGAGAKIYFIGCIPSLCRNLGGVFDIYSASWQPAATRPR